MTSHAIDTRKPSIFKDGFTIVELLIVIVVIAILAAIVTIAYNGIQMRAKESTLISDLSQNAKSVGAVQVLNGVYPEDEDAANIHTTLDNDLSYYVSPDRKDFCIEGTVHSKTFAISNLKGTPVLGYCDGFLAIEGVNTTPVASIFVGSGSNGYTEGTGPSAALGDPQGLAVDASGNMYVADMYNHRIRKVTPAGVTSSLAGNGSYGSGSGFANGTGTAASFSSPRDVAVDAAGNVYVADTANNAIRRVTPTGAVSTFAGASTAGTTDGTGTTARFNGPQGITIDTAGNLYVADTGNHRIRMITPSQVVSTVAGSSAGALDGTGTGARFNGPVGIEVEVAPSGNIYIADSNNHAVRMMTPTGVVTAIAGNGSWGNVDATGYDARFNNPKGLTVSTTGVIYVADRQNGSIRKISSSGVVTTYLGGGSFPQGIVFGVDGKLYSSLNDNRIYSIQ